MHAAGWLFAQINMAKVRDLWSALHDEQDMWNPTSPTTHHQDGNDQLVLLVARIGAQLLLRQGHNCPAAAPCFHVLADDSHDGGERASLEDGVIAHGSSSEGAWTMKLTLCQRICGECHDRSRAGSAVQVLTPEHPASVTKGPDSSARAV
jgi:hypothetical protein